MARRFISVNTVWGLAVSLLILSTFLQAADARPPSRIPEVKGYRVHYRTETPILVDRAAQAELERILDGVNRMAGMRSYHMPTNYLLFRFPSPVVLPDSPIGHPVREVIITRPFSIWDQPRLLVKNQQNQWVEYKTTRPLTTILDRVKPPGSKTS